MTPCTFRSTQHVITSNYKECIALSLPLGKLDLYVAAAGFQASQTLPCVLDMGTNNMDLRKDPTYMGLDQDRLDGDKFYEVQPSTHTHTHTHARTHARTHAHVLRVLANCLYSR